MSDVVRCPRCGRPLAGLATYCVDCEGYLEDMQAGGRPSAAATPDERLEKTIQHEARKVLARHGFDVYDLSQPRATKQTPGLADLFVVGHGRCAWVEMKTAKGGLTGAEKLFSDRVRRNGGEALVWRHEDEAEAWARTALQEARP